MYVWKEEEEDDQDMNEEEKASGSKGEVSETLLPNKDNDARTATSSPSAETRIKPTFSQGVFVGLAIFFAAASLLVVLVYLWIFQQKAFNSQYLSAADEDQSLHHETMTIMEKLKLLAQLEEKMERIRQAHGRFSPTDPTLPTSTHF